MKKEVSCRPLPSMLEYVKSKGIDLDRALEGIPYDLSYLLNRRERIEWWTWCRIIDNLRPYLSRSDFEQMGAGIVKNVPYTEAFLFSLMFFASGKLLKIAEEPLSKAADAVLKPMFSCFDKQWEAIEKNKYRVSLYLNPGYQQCPEWFYMSKGLWDELVNRVGLKGAKIDLSVVPNGGIFIVTLDREGFLVKFRKRMHWLFNLRKAFADLTASNEELLDNYNRLEKSKRLLQKQTKQLTTAYTITKSIRQSLEIDKTLNTITHALVHDAGLSSARVALFKDLDGNRLEAEASDGIDEMHGSTTRHPIVIHDVEIGELTICPRADTDILELDELLRYLLPIINISIHDSLVLRAISDYRDNLEIKVEERTANLKEAQDKLSEIIQVQSRFFANISHEFRTPLTLILGPLHRWLAETSRRDVQARELRSDLSMMQRNAHRLLTLINQLLDLSKLQAGAMKLRATRMDLVPRVKGIASSFESAARLRRIALDVHVEEQKIEAYCDGDMVEKILSNLLSNALKFTQEGGRVCVDVSSSPPRPLSSDPEKGGVGEGVTISVSDTGIGIPSAELDKVFDRFYQVDASQTREHEGSGLGLALVKELVELHHGTIRIQSELGRGTTITVQLPLGRGHLRDDEIVEAPAGLEPTMLQAKSIAIGKEIGEANEVTEFNQPETDKLIILVVEDNTDVRTYIRSFLVPVYQVTEARNGAEGVEIALEIIPDLIISDVMMPEKDGYQLCQTLKSDEKTSHVPIILLTAKAGSENKIEGLGTGADDYLIKPFEPDELRARVKNLIELRRKLRERFKASVPLKPGEIAVTSMDDVFLKKVMAAVEPHMGDGHFHVEGLAAEVGMSRVQVFRKLIALTSQSPGDFIRYIRLHRAKELLQKDFGTVSEVAYAVGFGDPSYFSKCFHKQFGKAPTDVRRSPAPTELSGKASRRLS